MKHRKSICSIVPALLFVLWSSLLSAQDFSERMVYEGYYKCSAETSFELSNKYGDIHIYNWEKDSIHITTELILTATSSANLRKLKDNVKIKYDERDRRVIAYTSFNDNASEILNQLQEFTKSIIPNQLKRIEANYTIYLPKNVSLKLRNQYGNITIDDVMGSVDLELFNGALSANKLSAASNFELRYAKANIQQINDGNFELIYSDLDLSKAISVKLESKISDIHIQDVGVCKIKSTRDDLSFDRLAYLYGESNYSKIRVIELSNELNSEMTFGKLEVNRILPSCTSVDIQSDRTDISLYTPKSLEYTFDITYHPDAIVHLPFESEAKPISHHELELLNTRGQTHENTQTNIKISAFKRCLIRIQDTFN